MTTHPLRCVARMVAAIALTALAACGTAPPAAPSAASTSIVEASSKLVDSGDVLARSDRFVVYRPGADDTLASIAARFLGSEERAWSIADFNGIAAAAAGQPLVVPLAVVNPTGVQADQYQTVPVLCYHRFGPGGGKMVVSADKFAAQLDWLARNDYRVIRLTQLAAFLQGREALPRRAVVITVDDGYASLYRYAWPLLRKHGFPATAFIYTDFIGAGSEALSWAQLQEMAGSGLIEIGAHSKTHRDLIERSAGESDSQYRQGIEVEARVPREIIERRLPVQVTDYAFPYGDADDVVLDVLARQHYELAVTVNPGGNAFFAQPLMLHRTMVFGDQDIEAFKAKLQVGRSIAAP